MWLARWWRNRFADNVQTFTDEQKVEAYVTAGAEMGQAVSYIYLGECVGFDQMLDRWETAERAYSDLGFRTLSIDDFTGTSWGHAIDHMLRVPRKVGEPQVLHAAYYRKHFFNQVGMHPAVVEATQGKASAGVYLVPSTKHLKQG